MIDLVAAIDRKRGIGIAHTGGSTTTAGMPWHLRHELQWFARLTSAKTPYGNPTLPVKPPLPVNMQTLIHPHSPPSPATNNIAVLMGRVTWETLRPPYKPLPGRTNIILSKNPLTPPRFSSSPPPQNSPAATAVKVAPNLEEALAYFEDAKRSGFLERLFVIGGESIYTQMLSPPFIRKVRFIYLTEIDKVFSNCTSFFPAFQDFVEEKILIATGRENDLDYSISRYQLVRKDQDQSERIETNNRIETKNRIETNS